MTLEARMRGWPCGHTGAEAGYGIDGCQKCGKSAAQFARERVEWECEWDAAMTRAASSKARRRLIEGPRLTIAQLREFAS